MPCDAYELQHVPLFALLDDEQASVLAAQLHSWRYDNSQHVSASTR
jgi:hypothetical protein